MRFKRMNNRTFIYLDCGEEMGEPEVQEFVEDVVAEFLGIVEIWAKDQPYKEYECVCAFNVPSSEGEK